MQMVMNLGKPEKKSVPLFAVQDFLQNQNMFEAIPLTQITQYTSKHAPTIDSEYNSHQSYYARSNSPAGRRSPQA